MAVKPIPDGYSSVTPYLAVDDAAKAITFYQKAFNAVELFRMEGPDHRIGHAEIKIGNSHVMLADECPGMEIRSPKTLGGAGISIMIYVDNVDVIYPQAIAAGGVELRPLRDQFYGDRSGTLKDPFGHVWTVSTHIADYSPEELSERAAAAMKSTP
ncbi:VOC family protein [Collimonas sp. NPDC087041]|uniref:VOC family protein n=1 Tax=Collimonas sp. NPDC087041 TaxID=3363960 RepID=UPI00382B99F2